MGGFVIKENFKRLEEDLKFWNKKVLGSADKRIKNIREEICRLDRIDVALGLDEEEIIKRNA